MTISKRAARKQRKRIMAKSCAICEIVRDAARLVCDHNHEINRIRGTLCNLCNSYVDIYERNKKRDRHLGGKRFYTWEEKYKDKIECHIQQDTGLPYHGVKQPNLIPPHRFGELGSSKQKRVAKAERVKKVKKNWLIELAEGWSHAQA